MVTTNLGDLIDLEQHGAIEAYVDLRDSENPVRWSRSAFADRIAAIGNGLRAAGLESGDRVAIVSYNRAEYIQAYLATMMTGMVAVPINFRLPQSTISFMLRDSNVKLAFVDSDHRGLVAEEAVQTVDFDANGGADFEAFQRPGAMEAYRPNDADIAKILYTSGSTGTPKGVMLGHEGQLWGLRKFVELAFPRTGIISQIVAPSYHKNGLFNAMCCLAAGATVVSLPRFDARTFLQTIHNYRCESVAGIPTMFAMIALESDLIESLDLTSVQSVVIGSAPLTQALIDRVKSIFPDALVTNGYGTTEAGAAIFGAHPDGIERPTLSIGHPFAEVAWELRGGPEPSEGALFLSTPSIMHGYQNLPDKTAEKVCDGWYETGDIMRHDANGFFYFVGRADDMFVSSGENIYPGEIEKILESHPAVVQAAVVPAPDDLKGAIPVAFVIAEGELDADTIKQHALAHGPAYCHPRIVEFVDTIPVAGTHKVDRKALIARAAVLSKEHGRYTGGDS